VLDGYDRAMQKLLVVADGLAKEEGLGSLEAPRTRHRTSLKPILEVRRRQARLLAEQGGNATQSCGPQTPAAGREKKEKDPGKGQGRGRPSEIPSG